MEEELLTCKNKPSTVAQPHDKIVKKLLSNTATAKDILKIFLPKEVLDVANLDILELQRDSFIDDEHRMFAVDLLYKTAFKNEEAYIWILLEHQSTPDYWMPVRLFKYIAIIWDHLRKTSKTKKIPLVYPLIIYNGQQPYTCSLNLRDLIYPEESQKLFDNFFKTPFQIIDLSQIQDETLRQHAQQYTKGIALLMTLKHIFDDNIQAIFEKKLMEIYKNLDYIGHREEVGDMLFYILNEGSYLNKERFIASLHRKFSPDVEDKIMTVAEQLRAEGQNNALENVTKRMLSGNFEFEQIAKITGFSISKIQKIKEAMH